MTVTPPDSPSAPRASGSWAWPLAALIGLLLSAAAAWPGLMSEDSIAQYQAAVSGVYADWHPPLMSWVWRQWLHVLPGPQGMLLMQLAMLWGALLLFCRAARVRPLAPLFLVLGLAPWVLNFSGVIWKDCAMAFALLLAAGLLLRPPGALRDAVVRDAAALLLLFYAMNLRHNALFALVPLLWWLLRGRWPLAPRRWLLAGGAGALVALLLAGQWLQYTVLGTQRQQPGNVALVDDLAHLSLVEGRSLIPGLALPHIQACAGRQIADGKLLNRYACFLRLDPAVTAPPVQGKLLPAWRDAVAAHPGAYLRYRLAALAYLLRAPDQPPHYARVDRTVPNDLGFAYEANGVGQAARWWVDTSLQVLPDLFKPYAWLAAAIALLAFSLLRARGAAALPERALLCSAIGYTVGYLPVTPLSDFRYVYWSVLATSVAALWMLLRPRGAPAGPLRPRRMAGVLLPSAFAIAALPGLDRWVGLDADAILRAKLPGGQRLAASQLRDLSADPAGLWHAQGPAPQWQARGLGLDIGRVQYLSFSIACDSSGSVPLQVRSWGDQQTGPEAGHTVDFVAQRGVNVIAFDTYRPWPLVRVLQGVQVDLSAGRPHCRTLTIGDITLHG